MFVLQPGSKRDMTPTLLTAVLEIGSKVDIAQHQDPRQEYVAVECRMDVFINSGA